MKEALEEAKRNYREALKRHWKKSKQEYEKKLRKQGLPGYMGNMDVTMMSPGRTSMGRGRTRRGAAGMATSGPGSEDRRDGIQASAEPYEGVQVSLRPPAF